LAVGDEPSDQQLGSERRFGGAADRRGGSAGTRDGRHQALVREVNERIEELAETFDLKDRLTILCECGSGQCDERIALREDQYEQLRRVPTHFAVRPGHEIPDVERVVERHDEFVIVEKFGESPKPAIRLDPRRRGG
jgi:hypothetical protein